MDTKVRWQLLQKLTDSERDHHLDALKVMAEANAGKRVFLIAYRTHLEPLLKHYHLTHLAVRMAEELKNRTGLDFTVSSYAKAAKEWGIPPGNEAGKGKARAQPGTYSGIRWGQGRSA